MKNIEQILKDAGLEMTGEQLAAVNQAVSENYKPISDYNKQVKNLETAKESVAALQTQLDTANGTLEKFKGMDPEKIEQEIADYKKAAEDAKAEAQKSITARDQRDFLNAEFDRLGISSARTRKSLMADIMGEDGLKWKDGAFMGLGDFLSKENEKDHFYLTDEEKAEQAKKGQAAGKVPKFTDKSEPKRTEPSGNPDVPVIF